MTLLFQEGIPGLFLPALVERGCRIFRFPNDIAAARKVFIAHSGAQAIFFRANFSFSEKELDLLPQARFASLVSTGTDNLDTVAFKARGIRLITGEGANAQAVFDYVIQALLFGGFIPERHSVGIVGAGRVGGRVLNFLKSLGIQTAHYDPFLDDAGSLSDVLQSDFVSFHVELSKDGEHATAAMLNAEYFAPAEKDIRIIQTCRGGIWDPAFYASLSGTSRVRIVAQDVYPEEPPRAADLHHAQFSTPHIAGYSTRGRLGGILTGIQGIFPNFDADSLWPEGKVWFLDKEAADFAHRPGDFSAIRDGYYWRREFHEYEAAERLLFRQIFTAVDDAFFRALFSFGP